MDKYQTNREDNDQPGDRFKQDGTGKCVIIDGKQVIGVNSVEKTKTQRIPYQFGVRRIDFVGTAGKIKKNAERVSVILKTIYGEK